MHLVLPPAPPALSHESIPLPDRIVPDLEIGNRPPSSSGGDRRSASAHEDGRAAMIRESNLAAIENREEEVVVHVERARATRVGHQRTCALVELLF